MSPSYYAKGAHLLRYDDPPVSIIIERAPDEIDQANSNGERCMRVGIYARVSTSDKDQNPDAQLLPLREFVQAQNWNLAGDYVDKASATDLRARVAWKRLLDDASKRKVDLVLVWRIDRAFRSVLDAANTLERLRTWNIGLRSYSEPWLDTTSPFGEALFYITSAYPQLEKGILVERVKAGMARAKKQGVLVGRPRVMNKDGVAKKWLKVRPLLLNGTMSQREAAKILGVGRATVSRLLAQKGTGNDAPEIAENAMVPRATKAAP
jgi:putative DNA-invertase from lambdoid prophage Rac